MVRQRYENLDGVGLENSFNKLMKWRKERSSKVKDMSYVVGVIPNKEVAFLANNRTQTTVTWIGHSTFLIQHGGLNMITDPVWANSMAVSKRLALPGLTLEELPAIDVMLLSHSHYDHMHLASLRAIERKHHPLLIVPIGLKAKMVRKGFANVQELAWWEQTTVSGVEIHFVPTQHWTKRTLTDTNTSHWGGYVIQTSAQDPQAVYFAGDSGYFRGFQLIGERFNIHTALMPIGAYEPEWFMKLQHVTPEEAVQAFLDVKAKHFVPMHYGAFRLADDTPKEALDRLVAEWKKQGLASERLHILLHGETLGADKL
ncbi:MBL fold metallo-hydrolase [Paenibacillus sp. N1-5-1-14]|uniref:MBL fold metallo-hydrolase n=1 Tax=Paenibacillus radicibacter TaxID=2972488 RepID=UPI0021595BCB|nr:MBL fold metallo-hydrolase [Paenibacillus radicibacter]MCR8643199.1 MBL fold metallo-hydrolase [Paenibacillus radicibacter]